MTPEAIVSGIRAALRLQLLELWHRRGIAYNDLAVAKKTVENAGRAYHEANCQYYELAKAISVVVNEPVESLEEEVSGAADHNDQGRDDQAGYRGGLEGDAAELAESIVEPDDTTP